jgi:hypothetical protein
MASLWRPSDAPRRAKPMFQPIVNRDELTDDERRRLAVWRDAYPLIEWVDLQQLRRLTFERWRWRNGDEQ